MISVDDLPPGINIKGAPRNLTYNDTQGMVSCGVAVPLSEPLAVEGVAHIFPQEVSKKDLHEIHKLLVGVMGDVQIPAHTRLAIQAIVLQGCECPDGMPTLPGLPVGDSSNSNNTAASPPTARSVPMNPQVGRNVSLDCLTVISWAGLLNSCSRPSTPRKSSARFGSVTGSVIILNKVNDIRELPEYLTDTGLHRMLVQARDATQCAPPR